MGAYCHGHELNADLNNGNLVEWEKSWSKKQEGPVLVTALMWRLASCWISFGLSFSMGLGKLLRIPLTL